MTDLERRVEEMVAPFAYYYGITPWQMPLLEHRHFLALERQARHLMKEAGDG